MNKSILDIDVQNFINANLNADVHTLAMGKSPFEKVTAKELATQIAAKKKCIKKLPLWFNTPFVYYPPLISVEQCSSEITAAYKAGLATGESLIDLTGGFGVDSFYYAKAGKKVTHCEINPELSQIAQQNAKVLPPVNLNFKAVDGVAYLEHTEGGEKVKKFHTIYVDPARRNDAGKVFMLKDCMPNVVDKVDLLLEKADRIIIKTSPLLDITSGLRELKNVSEVHIVSTRNECKELLFILDKVPQQNVKIISTSLNNGMKQFSFHKGEEVGLTPRHAGMLADYLYEPDVALLKSGAFDLIAQQYDLEKLNDQTQLYTAAALNTTFPGRIFKIDEVISMADLKKEKTLTGNVIVRNFPQKPAQLVKKHKIKADHDRFLIFTQSKSEGYIIIKATILQHY